MQDTNDLNELTNEIAARARDAAYTAVGLGILGIQKARSRRLDLASVAARAGTDDERLAQLQRSVSAGARQLAEWLDTAAQLVSASLAPFEAQLPEPAREVAGKARMGLCAISAQLRQLVAGA